MLKVDLHSHSHFSECGLHTVLEMLNYAKSMGLSALAVTDHGRDCGGHTPSPFFDRLPSDIVKGIRLLKGQESNVVSNEGDIDFPLKFLRFTDVVLLGLHPILPTMERRVKNIGD